jgi:beta-lactamase regulating signal transducer with metallopeptidase domain
MSFSFVQIYLSANVLLLLACPVLVSAHAVSSRLRQPLSYRHQLHFSYWLIAVSVIAPIVAALFVHQDFLPVTAQVWSAPSLQVSSAQASSTRSATISLIATGTQLRLDLVTQVILAICVGGVAIALARILISAESARRIIARAHHVRRRGVLRILATTESSVPFSFWSPGRFFIVVPVSLINHPNDMWIAIQHEAQHHRQGDTKFVYVRELLKGAFLLNPALHFLCNCVRQLQEFACDAAVIGRQESTVSAYCDCLLRVAQNALADRLPRSCMGMADRTPRTLLARRINVLLESPKQQLRAPITIAIQTAAIAALLATGILLAGTVQDRRVSASQAVEMAATARRETSFPIVINPQVIAELNRLVGTPDGRAFLRESMQRMHTHEALITQRLYQRGLPAELLAVPLVESGYRNRPQDANPRHGAGIWMFIEPTARTMSLTIDGTRDDRLNLALETDAATQLLSRLNAEFGDWGLALLAYNGGSAFVDRSIRETGTRDAFEIAQLGYERDPHYLARVMATIILMKNARLLHPDLT